MLFVSCILLGMFLGGGFGATLNWMTGVAGLLVGGLIGLAAGTGPYWCFADPIERQIEREMLELSISLANALNRTLVLLERLPRTTIDFSSFLSKTEEEVRSLRDADDESVDNWRRHGINGRYGYRGLIAILRLSQSDWKYSAAFERLSAEEKFDVLYNDLSFTPSDIYWR